MSVEAVGSASEEFSLALEGNYRDFFGDKIQTLANLCIKPFWFVEQKLYSCFLPLHPREYGQAVSKIQEVCRRLFTFIFSVPAMLASLPFYFMGMALTGIGNVIKTRAYRYVEGNYHGEFTSQPKVFHLNACMFPGSLPCAFGGVSPASMRFDRLVTTIRENDPDIVFLCEFNRGLRMSMVNALKDRYSHFAIDVGLNATGLESSFFIAYRGELASPPLYIPFKEERKGMNSGFFMFETPDTYYVTTHLKNHEGTEEDTRTQLAQLKQILSHIENEWIQKRVVFMGDFNFERNSQQYQLLMEKGFIDRLSTGEETCTNAMQVHMDNLEEAVVSESIDYMLVLDRSQKKSQLDLHIVKSYIRDEYLHEALSDHHILIGVLA